MCILPILYPYQKLKERHGNYLSKMVDLDHYQKLKLILIFFLDHLVVFNIIGIVKVLSWSATQPNNSTCNKKY